jgi:hypothetical protein
VNSKFKPCPFCAREPVVTVSNQDDAWESMPGWRLISRFRVLRVACSCGAKMKRLYKHSTIDPTGVEHIESYDLTETRTMDDLRAAWNRRRPTTTRKAKP